MVTDNTGRATWLLTPPLPAVPVVMGTPAAGGPRIVTVEEAASDRVTVRVWRPGGKAAGAGVGVHLVAWLSPEAPPDTCPTR